MGVRLFRLSVDTSLALCNHSLTFVNVDVSKRRHRVKERGQATHYQTTVIVDITTQTALVRAAEQRKREVESASARFLRRVLGEESKCDRARIVNLLWADL
jgi:hypothetical protein